MSGTIPPIPSPFRTSSGNPRIPNVNRVDTMPTTTDPINTSTTTNVSQSVVDENLPKLLDSRGGVRLARKPLDKFKETCFACEKLGHFQKDNPSHKTYTPSYPSSNNSFNKSKPYTQSFNQTSSQNYGNHQKYYKGKYKRLKAKMVVLTKRIDDMTKGKSKNGKKEKEKNEKGLIAESFEWDDESVSPDDEGSTKIRGFMEIAEDEPSVGKADARSGQ
nr:hypothetical protein [Tanacetum cinerariifolium]